VATKTLKLGISLSDRVFPLLDGSAPPKDIKFDIIQSSGDIFKRALSSNDFDVTEMSLAAHAILRSRSDPRFVGLPLFTSRIFRHSAIYVSSAAGINKPSDLAGKRVGLSEYQSTSAVWLRGILQEYYGVNPESMKWVKGGVDKPGSGVDRIPLSLPPKYEVSTIAQDTTLSASLLKGEIDALISSKIPGAFSAGGQKVKRLFPDSRAAEVDYFKASGVFPIMHMLVMSRPAYEENPQLANSVYEAFLAAKKVSEHRLYETDALACMIPWMVPEMDNIYKIMGKDFWPYGMQGNRQTVGKFIEYLRSQDLLKKEIKVDDLFVKELAGS
jgi:4,5-dihydroxyphthalate decarboxylase